MGQESSAQGLPWVSQNKRFCPEGARNAHAIRFKGSEPILAIPGDPFRANSVGKVTQVNPRLYFHGPSGRTHRAKQIPNYNWDEGGLSGSNTETTASIVSLSLSAALATTLLSSSPFASSFSFAFTTSNTAARSFGLTLS